MASGGRSGVGVGRWRRLHGGRGRRREQGRLSRFLFRTRARSRRAGAERSGADDLRHHAGARVGRAPRWLPLFVDYDNDGLLDLLTWSADGPHVARNLGTSWTDETAAALSGSGSRAFSIASSRALGVAISTETDVRIYSRSAPTARRRHGALAGQERTARFACG